MVRNAKFFGEINRKGLTAGAETMAGTDTNLDWMDGCPECSECLLVGIFQQPVKA